MRPFLILLSAFASALGGCSVREQPAVPPQNQTLPPTARNYVDLEPGWRVKVTTPIFRSGKFLLSRQAIDSGKAGSDFVGYEVAYYAIEARRGGGVSIYFASAQRIIGGKSKRARHPMVDLFHLPENDRYIRLLFFIRVSQADHDEGILAAASLQQLVEATREVLADPEANCRTHGDTFCSWIPRGIVAQAEKRAADGKHWVWTW